MEEPGRPGKVIANALMALTHGISTPTAPVDSTTSAWTDDDHHRSHTRVFAVLQPLHRRDRYSPRMRRMRR